MLFSRVLHDPWGGEGGVVKAFVTVTTTVDTDAKAIALARVIVEQRLAACVQRLPVESTYQWQGAIEEAKEILLVAKTQATKAAALMDLIREHHSYETPEIVVTPIKDGLPEYLAWIEEETSPEE